MSTIAIFCEGKGTSLDYKIFKKLIPNGNNKTIVALGGKFGSPAFIEGWLNRGGVQKFDFSFFLKDRDFDYPVPTAESLVEIKANDGKFYYAGYRATIENYLLNTQMLHDFCNKTKKVSKDEINKILEDAGKLISFYSAVRHSLGKIRKPIKLETTWTNGSGYLPNNDILSSKDKCSKHALELIKKYQDDSIQISEFNFETSFEEFLDLFNKKEFWEDKKYLIWFHGKDLQKAISPQILSLVPGFSWDAYYNYAIDNTDFMQFADYKNFVSKIESVG